MTAKQQSPAKHAAVSISNHRLWLQLAMSAMAWVGLSVADMLITWRACRNDEQFGGASVHPGAQALYFAITGLLFALAALTGVLCYRTWRTLSDAPGFLQAEGRERSEYMSQAGVFVSFTLACGMVWFCLPLFLIQMCLRTR